MIHGLFLVTFPFPQPGSGQEDGIKDYTDYTSPLRLMRAIAVGWRKLVQLSVVFTPWLALLPVPQWCSPRYRKGARRHQKLLWRVPALRCIKNFLAHGVTNQPRRCCTGLLAPSQAAVQTPTTGGGCKDDPAPLLHMFHIRLGAGGGCVFSN